jgi:DNA-directed RNA polymerase specialized sigma24 family protein
MNADSVGWTSDTTLELRLRDLIPRGYRLACGMLHDPGRAEDAVQEAALAGNCKQQEARDIATWLAPSG